MKKCFFIILLISLLTTNNVAYASFTHDVNGNLILTPDSYTADGKIKTFHTKYGEDDFVIYVEIDKLERRFPKITFYGADDKKLSGTLSYPNIDDVVTGEFELQWVFTPDDSHYEIINGVFHLFVYPEDSEKSKGAIEEPEEEAISLTATSLLLAPETSYDINLNNKISGSTYTWTSSDKSVATVNKSGLVRTVGKGTTTVKCEVVTPDNTTEVLSTDVIVGLDDDNYPVLNASELDLEVGELFDLNIGNKIAKSQYFWKSSDKTVARVTSTNGKVTGLKTGNVTIYCTITTEDNEAIVLTCNVEVHNEAQ